MLNRILLLATLGVTVLTNPRALAADTSVKHDVGQFLEFYNHAYQRLYTANQEAQWKSMTDVTPEGTDTMISGLKNRCRPWTLPMKW